MREIKFRAWEAIEKRFLLWDEVQENTIQDVFRPFDYQQFTGLRDKNGNEIYEGDVVEWLVNGDVVRRGIVEYVAEFGGYDMKNFSDEYHVCNDWLRGEYTVLGNIYENPELVTQ